MIVTRRIRSTPYRDSAETWSVIVQLLTQFNQDARRELDSVAGVASSCIADQASKNAPIIVTCDGPRTRIYCVFDDEALDQTDFNEGVIGFDPMNGNWSISLPCTEEDLSWVQVALLKHSSRISARDLSSRICNEENSAPEANELTLNLKGFLGQ